MVLTKKIICFDLEGPLSPQDNAYDVMSEIPYGKELFEKISRYDDLLTLGPSPLDRYEAGDTLALIVPFLSAHDISNSDISRVSKLSVVVPGAKELINVLFREGWDVFVISTSYEWHAYNIGSMLGIPRDNIFCTRLDLSKIKKSIDNDTRRIILDAEKEILKIEDDKKLKQFLDGFFFEDLPRSSYGNVLDKVKVIGGQKKLDVLNSISDKFNTPLSDIIAVGDSITDYKMLEGIKRKNGVSIVFNGNEYAIPYASIGLAALDIRWLHLITSRMGDFERIFDLVDLLEEYRFSDLTFIKNNLTTDLTRDLDDIPFFHNLLKRKGRSLDDIIVLHKKYRRLIRGSAARLG
ncbi:MAG: hypothetical protein EF806_05230 [Candidatus Methanoliparum thermophilum]|uniref:phosphoserine phosphatase n=1 Tax=Methanoliparum thermophilum TaxID=2491083 RepID=A0A520KQZ3_METT2|nr:HAD hydrolase family protein [Candidatus Methanoliparum sp. LAM-1]RZN64024.1 MAG: hypothetical protein EF806_05230 [Candidatus Methanoliparum thermophilum]BDC35722.1 hypothetical protein MTLP_04040 [Candidatus Methanoliparum sp. LAM-1]